MKIDAAMNEFNSGQFKILMKKMAPQVNFDMYLNLLLPPDLFGAWMLADICPKKALLTYTYTAYTVLVFFRSNMVFFGNLSFPDH